MFLKANSALVGCSAGVALRFLDRRTDPEAEFTYVIGKQGTDIPYEKALDYVFGYTIGIDMSLRGSEPPSTRKSIDSYAMVGPWIVTPDEVPDPGNVGFTLTVNGQVLQRSNTNNMQFGVADIISHASKFFTLYPGDIIMAGTPLGFDPSRPGDKLIAEFDHIGKMKFSIRRSRLTKVSGFYAVGIREVPGRRSMRLSPISVQLVANNGAATQFSQLLFRPICSRV